MTIDHNGNVRNNEGRLVHLSAQGFAELIAGKDACFICGRPRCETSFNDEHVIPRWLLRRHDLHSQMITTLNGAHLHYGEYTIPCCQSCNSLMASALEDPLAKLFDQGYSAVTEYAAKNGPWLFLVWLALLFIKVHYRDVYLRLWKDTRKPDNTIADLYEWQELHHVYCIARSFYSGAVLDPSAMSSFVIVPAYSPEGIGSFDYADLYDMKATLLRSGQIALMAIHNDGCAAQSIIRDTVARIRGELNPLQLRELFVSLAYANHITHDRPEFYTEIDTSTEKYRIWAKRKPTFSSGPGDDQEYGALQYSMSKDLLEIIPSDQRASVRDNILTGRYSFLFNANGEFVLRAPERRKNM